MIVCSACNSESNSNEISFAKAEIKIDGIGNEKDWQNVSWRPIDQRWLGEEYTQEDFKGRYKIMWDQNYLYILAEIVDDVLTDTHNNGLEKYWDDDCLEIFIDEDASKGDHQYNYNAFAYHIALDGRVVDISTDSLAHYYNHIKSKRLTKANSSVWELSMEIYDDSFSFGQANTKTTLTANKEIGFAIAYCDNDHSEERENFIGSAKVEGEDKNRGWIDAGIFEKFVLVK